ncbi:MAG TPA: septum formation initiator [Azospirillum sp.]|nr:septum formation initiator [Azospirillum sp.]
MPFHRSLAALLLAVAFASPVAALAQDGRPDAKPRAEQAEKSAPFEAQRTVTRHSLALPSGALAYTAVAEFLPVREAGKDEVLARVFTTTYTADGAEPRRRPVAFVFNGGPGAASAYLHLGALGPKVVRFNEDGSLPRPPVPMVDNPDTWLAFTDLVFIDPVGTGYSRALKDGEDAEKRFWKVDADTRYLSEIVRLWVVRNDRWSSPKLLVGESYGGFRVAKMAGELFQRAGVAVNALVMVSPVLDFGTIADEGTGLLTDAFKLPSMAAGAAAHGRIEGSSPAEAAERAERFALTGWLSGVATLDIGRLDASAGLFAEVAQMIGLPVEMVARHRGRVPARVFARELLRDKGRVLSVYDAAFTGPDLNPGSPRVREDPYLSGTVPVYSTAFTSYVQQELNFRTEVPFRLLNQAVSRGWEWPRQGHASAMEELRTVLGLTPGLHAMIAHGRNDLVTPYLASRWLAAQIELPPEQRGRIRVPVYDGGHMMYTLAGPRARLAADTRALLDDALR